MIRVTYSLHPFFLTSNWRKRCNSPLSADSVRLNKLYLFGLHEEYYEYVSGEQRLFVNVDFLECMSPDRVLSEHRRTLPETNLLVKIADAWE